MSANNQTLIKEHKGKFYVFSNVMAETWVDDEDETKINELPIKRADGVFDNRDDAFIFAKKLDYKEYTEYGVQFNRLCKDDSEVKLIEE